MSISCLHKKIGVLLHLEKGEYITTIIHGPTLGCLDCGAAVYIERISDNIWMVREDVRTN